MESIVNEMSEESNEANQTSNNSTNIDNDSEVESMSETLSVVENELVKCTHCFFRFF